MARPRYVTLKVHGTRFSSSLIVRAYEKAKQTLTRLMTRIQVRKSLDALSEAQLRDFGLTKHDVTLMAYQAGNPDGTWGLDKIRESRLGNW